MRILVTGASGRVGSQLVRQLGGHEVVATSRSAPPSDAPADISWLRADLSDPEPWPGIIEGCDAAFLFPAFGHTSHFIEAAARADLSRLVLLSSGAVSDIEDSFIKEVHAEIEEQARVSGVPTVSVRPTVFMANDLSWAETIKQGGTVDLAYPTASMPVIAEQDIAAAIAACLVGEGDAVKAHEITGPRSLTQLERLEMLAKHLTGQPAQWSDITEEARENGLPDMPGPPGEYLLRNLAEAASNPVQPTDDLRQLLQRPATDYAEWVAKQ